MYVMGMLVNMLCIFLAAVAQVLLLHHQERARLADKQAQERRAACYNSSSNTSRCAAPDSSTAGLTDFGGNVLEDESTLHELSLVGEQGVASLPDNCRVLCQARGPQEEAAVQLRLHQALPLLPLDVRASRRIRWVQLCGQT
jgi:hypothetical protein